MQIDSYMSKNQQYFGTQSRLLCCLRLTLGSARFEAELRFPPTGVLTPLHSSQNYYAVPTLMDEAMRQVLHSETAMTFPFLSLPDIAIFTLTCAATKYISLSPFVAEHHET